MAGDAKHLEIWCADSADHTFRALFDEKKLAQVRDSVDKTLSWEKFFRGVEEGFNQRKVQVTQDTGSMSLLVECLLGASSSSAKKMQFRLDKTGEPGGCLAMLQSMQEFYWMRADQTFKARLIGDIEAELGDGGKGSPVTDPKAMAAAVQAAPDVEKATKTQLEGLQKELAQASSSTAAKSAGDKCAEE
eukprot:335308_1